VDLELAGAIGARSEVWRARPVALAEFLDCVGAGDGARDRRNHIAVHDCARCASAAAAFWRPREPGDAVRALSPEHRRRWVQCRGPGRLPGLAQQTHSFEDMAAMRGYGGISSGVQSELPEVVQTAGGSANLFSRLGVSPVFGRTFTEAEDQPNGEPVVLLTWSIFQRRFGGDPSIIGKQVHLDTYRPPSSACCQAGSRIPMRRFSSGYLRADVLAGDYGMHDGHQSMVVGRLKPGLSADAATREVSALQYQIHLANASKPVAEDVWFRPMIDDLAKNVRTPLLVLLGAVGCMLLIACLNLTNLLVARSATRRREVAVRGALGGSRVVLICEQMARFHESLLERLRRLPGVRGAGLVSVPPGAGPSGDRTFTILERPAPSYSLQYDAIALTADPQYFSVMQIPLLRGRVFTEHERLSNDHHLIVSKHVDRYLPGDDPVGEHVRVGWDTKPEVYEILGEVGDTISDITKPVEPTMYFPIWSGIPARTSEATIVAYTSADPLTMSMPIQRQISALEPELPVYNALTMDQILGKTSASQGFAANLVLAFAALSLLLAAVGLYGVLSYLTTQRTPDISLRIAVGVPRSQLLRLVLFEGLSPVLIGLIFGIAASALATHLVRSMVYGTRPLDPAAFAGAATMLVPVAVLACLIPACRASRIDPIQALRTE
jgi:MacB-like periplasmic core domain/FtsX-like permease family